MEFTMHRFGTKEEMTAELEMLADTGIRRVVKQGDLWFITGAI